MVDQVFKQATMGILLFSLFPFLFPTIVFYLLNVSTWLYFHVILVKWILLIWTSLVTCD